MIRRCKCAPFQYPFEVPRFSLVNSEDFNWLADSLPMNCRGCGVVGHAKVEFALSVDLSRVHVSQDRERNRTSQSQCFQERQVCGSLC